MARTKKTKEEEKKPVNYGTGMTGRHNELMAKVRGEKKNE